MDLFVRWENIFYLCCHPYLFLTNNFTFTIMKAFNFMHPCFSFGCSIWAPSHSLIVICGWRVNKFYFPKFGSKCWFSKGMEWKFVGQLVSIILEVFALTLDRFPTQQKEVNCLSYMWKNCIVYIDDFFPIALHRYRYGRKWNRN